MAVKRWLRTLFFGSSIEVYGTFSHEVLRRMLLVGLGALLWSCGVNHFAHYLFEPQFEWIICLFFAFQFGLAEGMLRRSWRIGLIVFTLITIAVGSTIIIDYAYNGYNGVNRHGCRDKSFKNHWSESC